MFVAVLRVRVLTTHILAATHYKAAVLHADIDAATSTYQHVTLGTESIRYMVTWP